MATRSISEEWLRALSVAQLEAEVRRANRLYWDEHRPELSDYDYDRIVNRLRALAPGSKLLEDLGASAPVVAAVPVATAVAAAGVAVDAVVGEAPPVRHKARMLSLDKCYSHEELLKWSHDFKGRVMVSPKFDGIACSLHYDGEGRLSLAATRGDGAVGENITANARVIEDIPQTVGARDVEVRGELYMRRSVFERYKAEGFANPRNLAAGAIKQKDPARSRAYGLSFAAYDLVGTDHATEHEKIEALARMGFAPIERAVVEKSEMVAAYERLAARRDALDFEIDGVVYKADSTDEQRRLGATSHHPRYAIAYKFQGDSGTTIVREIEWSVSRSGVITPVALIDPVTLSGATVSRASLHHAGFLDKLALTKNATVVVMRRGGVIPNVEFVSKPGDVPFELPTECPSCGGPVRREGDFFHCAAPRSCRSSVIGQLSHYADVVGILGFGDSLLAQAFDRGLLRRPADFYGLTERKLLALDRMGSRLAKRLLREIDRARTLDLATFLRAFGMHEVGKLVSEILAERYGSLERIYGVDEVELATIHRIGPVIARAVVRAVRETRDEIEATRAHVTLIAAGARPAASAAEASTGAARGVLAGQSFVFTGTLVTLRRAEAERLVKDRGGIAQDNVTRALHFLVVGDQRTDEKSTKEKTAEKFIEQGAPLRILREKEFLALVKEADARAAEGESAPAKADDPPAASSRSEPSVIAPAVSPVASPALTATVSRALSSSPTSAVRAPFAPRDSSVSSSADFALAPAAMRPTSVPSSAPRTTPAPSKPPAPRYPEPAREARPLVEDPAPDRRKQDPTFLALFGALRARAAAPADEGGARSEDDDGEPGTR
jgi:DNA ligase (NAD+)